MQRILAVIILLVAVVLTAFWLNARERSVPQESTPTVIQPLAAEFEEQEALLLGGTMMVANLPKLLGDIVEAVGGHLTPVVLVKTQEEEFLARRILTRRQVPVSHYRILKMPIMTMWVRDFGPHLLQDSEGNRSLAGFHYRRRNGNITDNTIPASLAEIMGLPLREFPLLLEGGDFLSLSTNRMMNRNIHYKDMTEREMEKFLAAGMGFTRWDALPHLVGEPTGHVDMFVTLAGPDLAVVGSYNAADDSTNARLLDVAATQLAASQTGDGRFFRVERIPMPPRTDGVWRTYTNVVYANGVLLVPTYPNYCPELDAKAMQFYRELLPCREVVGVDASGLIRLSGALRCVSMNVPAFKGSEALFP